MVIRGVKNKHLKMVIGKAISFKTERGWRGAHRGNCGTHRDDRPVPNSKLPPENFLSERQTDATLLSDLALR